MTSSATEVQGYERASKYPKSTKYGRQNPISERWNSEEQLLLWRKAWADVTNRYLEQYGHDARIDHRSHAERDLDKQPTVPAIAEAMERLRSNMLIFKYQLLHIGGGKQVIDKSLKMYRVHMAQYTALADKISKKSKERKAALDEKKATPVIQVLKHRDLAKRIAELTEDLEELLTEKAMLLRQLQYPRRFYCGYVPQRNPHFGGRAEKVGSQRSQVCCRAARADGRI